MGYFQTWHDPFFTGSAATAVGAGTLYHVTLGGRGYMLDLDAQGQDAYNFASLPLLRRFSLQASAGEIGEESLNAEDYWRRSTDSWHLGAGQEFFDHPDSDRSRFRISKGIDPWTPGVVSLLNDTYLRHESTATNLALAVAGDYLYFIDGNILYTTTDEQTFYSYAESVLRDVPTCYLRLGESSGSIAVDDSVTPHDGNYYLDPVYNIDGAIADDGDDAIQFGTPTTNDAYATVPSTAFNPGNGPFTIEAWVRFESTPVLSSFIFMGVDGTSSLIYQIGITGHQALTYNSITYTCTDPMEFDGDWHHVAVTYGSATVRFYFDGVLCGSTGSVTAHAYTPFTTAANVGGAWLFISVAAFYGQMDEFATYTTALSAARIAVHYDAGLGNREPFVHSAVNPDFTTSALSSPTSITSDGYTIWTCDSTRVNYTIRSNNTFASYHAVDHPATLIRSVKGRLITAGYTTNKRTLYTHSGTAGAAVAAPFYTHPSLDWTWTDISAGPAAIYFAGYAGDSSIVYKTTIEADGTDLQIPTVALELPSGEIVRSLHAYLSVLCIGTNQGVRIAEMADDGTLAVGDLIDTPECLCFASQAKFVWFGWTSYDNESTGLGRLDLSTFNQTAPAYTSDVMATTQGTVTSAAVFNSARVFAVSGAGIYSERLDTLVPHGTIYSGWIGFGLSDPKTIVKFVLSHRKGAGTITSSVSTDGSLNYVQMGAPITTTANAAGSDEVTAGPSDGAEYEVKMVLIRGDVDDGPVVSRWTLMGDPTVRRRITITAPFLLHRQVQLLNRSTKTLDPSFERAEIASLMQSGQMIPFQELGASYQVTVDDFHWVPYEQVGTNAAAWDGTLVTELKVQV